MDRQPVSTVPYANLVARLVVTIVLAVSAVAAAWVFLFTPDAGTSPARPHHAAQTR
jgi:hypothetical protein